MTTASGILVDRKAQFGIADISRRIWTRDTALWPDPSPGGEGEWMGWLRLPTLIRDRVGFANHNHWKALEGITSINILGMGGSSLTPEVLSVLFPEANPSLNVFDTVNPATISAALENIDLTTAAFVVASKSGTTVEPLSLEAVFRNALSDAGVANPSERFIAISDPETPLSERAANGDFAFNIETPANVGGRFSALTAFGMFPASFCHLPTQDLVRSAITMTQQCRHQTTTNPGIELGLFLARNALRGRDKVTFAMSPSLERFGLWLEQLLAESTGKNNRGLIPIAGEPLLPPDAYGNDRQFIRITLAGEAQPESPAFDKHPTYDISLPDRTAIAGEFFRWEFATAVAACAIGVYPFDQPDVESAKQFARAALESKGDETLAPTSLNNALDLTIDNITEGDYIAIAAFLPESDRLTSAASNLRSAISQKTGIPTTFGYGPRYLHSTGQLHKGGPKSVALIALTQEPEHDIEVPGQTYTLGNLLAAQATGDVQALRNTGRRAHLVKLKRGLIEEIEDTPFATL